MEERRSLFMNISIHRSLATKLKELNKGSYNRAINFLLGNKVDDSTKGRIEEIDDRIIKLEETVEKVVKYNKLRF